MKYYLAIKKEESIDTWMNLKNIILSKRRQTQNVTLFHLYEISRTDKSTETKHKNDGCQGWREKAMKRNCLKGKEFYFGVMEMLWN